MNEHLIIRNFGPVTSLDIDIKPFTVFIGEQGSGKSTISKVLTICRHSYMRYAIYEGKEDFFFDRLKEYGVFSYLNDKSYISYSGDYSFVFDNYKFTNFDLGHYSKVRKQQFISKLSGRDLTTKNDTPSLLRIQQTINDINIALNTLLYIPSERLMATQLFSSLANIIINKIPIGQPMLEYMSLFEKARKAAPSYEVPFLEITYKFANGKDFVEVANSKTFVSVPMEEASSGIQSVLPLLMVFDYCSKQGYFNSFVIEEPEQNLFPSSQVELLRFILSRRDNEDKDARFVLTTHSPYMLSALNNYLYAAELANNPLVDKAEVDAVVPSNCQISVDDCVVYSLGKNLNGGEYCKSVISKETRLIDFNYLDKVSMDMGSEFDRLQNIYLNSLRKNRK